MRFRTKFAWLQLGSGIVWMAVSYLWIHKPSAAPGVRGAYLIAGLIWMSLSILSVASYHFTWWEISDAGLIQKRLWSTRTIPWSEIICVGPWQPGKRPNYAWLEVGYARSAPMSDRGTLLIQPAERDALVHQLRARAPQADFDFFPFEL